ncbi:MAG: cytidine deaminase [Bacteroidia bacterium]|nr:cytidine deaminase [Bacteroidia bacterium]
MTLQRVCSIETSTIDQLSEPIQNLLKEASMATQRAYAPYSNFYVGAAVLLSNGEVVTGNNQENAAFPSGLCAERVAILAAKATYPTEQLIGLAIAVRTERELKQAFTPSCGACLQVMSDVEQRQEPDLPVYIQGPNNQVYIAKNVGQFLPFGFEL